MLGEEDEMKTESKKSYAIAVCLSAIFGVLGIQHFYLGRYLLGLADLTLSVLAFYFFISGQLLYALLFFSLDFSHTLVVTIRLLTGSFEDGEGHIVCYPGQELNKR
ncbi:MAG: NINE protein [Thermodesulfobacteriota bacterium]|nr:NINE protein [Thermodesulfobacteriota bacterium]